MYVPGSFQQNDRKELATFLARHSFALLVSQLGGEPFATHLPLIADLDAPPSGLLLGHVARANPQWRELAGQPVLAVFSGPHAYVSPSWYEAAGTVPTWNYLAVHVYGRCTLVEDEVELAGILDKLTQTYESSLPEPWRFDAGNAGNQKMLPAIVGLRIEVERIEGKWKLGQNQPEERRAKAARQLLKRTDADSQAIGRLMLETCRSEGGDAPRSS